MAGWPFRRGGRKERGVAMGKGGAGRYWHAWGELKSRQGDQVQLRTLGPVLTAPPINSGREDVVTVYRGRPVRRGRLLVIGGRFCHPERREGLPRESIAAGRRRAAAGNICAKE